MTSIVLSLQDPEHWGEDNPDRWPLLGALPKINIGLMIHPAGLQVLVQCILTKLTLPKVEAAYLQRRDGLEAAMHRDIDYLPTLPKGVLPLRRNRPIGQRHPNLLPLSLQFPLFLQPQPRRFFLQHNRDACLMSAYASIVPKRLHCINSLVCGKYNLFPAPLAL